MDGNDWRDGFLFVGNHLALDFLNTRPVIDGAAQELLPDSDALVRWLEAAGLIAKSQAFRLRRQWQGQPEGDLEPLRQFRENLRKAVLQVEGGSLPSTAFVDQLNKLLREHPSYEELTRQKTGFERHQWFDPHVAGDAFGPLAHDVALLLARSDWSRLRKCHSCVLHFFDTSKKGTRVWCSMNLCGNRAKVAAYAARRRTLS